MATRSDRGRLNLHARWDLRVRVGVKVSTSVFHQGQRQTMPHKQTECKHAVLTSLSAQKIPCKLGNVHVSELARERWNSRASSLPPSSLPHPSLSEAPAPESNAAVDRLVATLIAARFVGKRPRPVADPWSKESWSVRRPACAQTAWKAARAKGPFCARHPVRENSARPFCRSDNWHESQLQPYRRFARSWIGRVRHF
jgi:hypothetical protein